MVNVNTLHIHDAGEISVLLVDSAIVRAHSSAAGVRKKMMDKPVKPSVEAMVALRRNSMRLSVILFGFHCALS